MRCCSDALRTRAEVRSRLLPTSFAATSDRNFASHCIAPRMGAYLYFFFYFSRNAETG